jgi:DNA-binding IclR family transcriptional regulator
MATLLLKNRHARKINRLIFSIHLFKQLQLIQVIVRALNILEFVAKHENSQVQLIKIAEHAGLSQPTTANIVKTLVDRNYLEQIGRKKGYRLGIGAYQLTGNPSYQQNLITTAKEHMEKLTTDLNENSILAVIRNNKRVILHLTESSQMLQVKTIMVTDIYNASTGRLLMAYYSEAELDSLIKAIGLPAKDIWPGAETRIGLNKKLQQIREDKFVQLVSVYHTVGFAVPIYKKDRVTAALSVFVPQSRYTEAIKNKISKKIRLAAKKISMQLKND